MEVNYANETGSELPTEAVTNDKVEAAAPAAGPVTAMPPSHPPQVSKFDPARLRVSQSFGELAGTRKVLASVPVTKPNKQQWVRVHPDAGYRESFALIEEKESRTTYLVDPSLVSELAEEVIYVTLHTAITREGTLFLWPVRLPNVDGRPNSWFDSAREAAAAAAKGWVRVVANMSTGGYDYLIAPGTLAEPEWPDTSYGDLLSIAFKGGRFIDTLDHPLVSRLQGVK